MFGYKYRGTEANDSITFTHNSDNSDVIDLQHARHILISLAHKSASPALTHLVMNSYATFTSRSLIPGVSCGVYHAPSSLLRPSLSVKLSPCRSCLLLRPAGNKSHRSDSCCKQRRRVHSHKQAERKKTEEGKKKPHIKPADPGDKPEMTGLTYHAPAAPHKRD